MTVKKRGVRNRPSTSPRSRSSRSTARTKVPAEPKLAGGNTEISGLRRALLNSLRASLLPEVEAINGYTQMLREDAADRPTAMLADVEKLLAVTTELHIYIKEEVEETWAEGEDHDFDERLRRTRHDIGNRLNHALGFCQLLMMAEDEHFFGQLVEDLKKVQCHCGNCVAALAQFKERSSVNPQQSPRSGVSTPSVVPEFSPASPHPKVAPATILVVDDNRTTCELLARFLSRQQHAVEIAESGEAALQALQRREFDLVLLDYLMPELNGLGVLQRIKDDEKLRHVPVIMISALDAVEDMAPCIECGAEDYLIKPINFVLLNARVNASLDRLRLREREFGQFFTPELARHFVRHPELIREGREAEVTILFCDVRGFSRLSERLSPSDTVRWLSDVMATLSECVLRHRGVLVDYIGDELMAMWGAPEEVPNHADLACSAATAMLDSLGALNARWQDVVQDVTDVGIGLNSGIAHVGNTGSSHKFKYGPLGNTVNLASRVQGATKHLNTRLLVTGPTKRMLSNGFHARRVCQVRVVNIREPVELYELLPESHNGVPSLCQRYEEALGLFEDRRLPEAAAILGNLLVDAPHDGPSLLLVSRVVDRLLRRDDAFDPVWELPGK